MHAWTTRERNRRLFYILVTGWFFHSLNGFSQSPPVDLSELSLEDLLSIQLVDHRTSVDEKNSVQIGYAFIQTEFEDYREGSRDRTSESLLAEFPVVPNRIDQEAHVLTVGYRASDELTLLLEASYIQQKTDHIRRNGGPFTIRTEGLGDLSLRAAHRFYSRDHHHLYLLGGISIPTGSITEKGDTPRGKNTQVPYTMQLGSGTFDVEPGVLYVAKGEYFDWGTELRAIFRLGRNDRGYSLGDRGALSVWVKAKPTRFFSPLLKVTYVEWGEIDGEDDKLDPTVAPVADPELAGGSKVIGVFGAELSSIYAEFPGALLIECGIPMYESLNGPQPSQQWQMMVSLKSEF